MLPPDDTNSNFSIRIEKPSLESWLNPKVEMGNSSLSFKSLMQKSEIASL